MKIIKFIIRENVEITGIYVGCCGTLLILGI
jgi:hypothetical protein